jgi:hypothetical protein
LVFFKLYMTGLFYQINFFLFSRICSTCRKHLTVLSPCMTYHRFCSLSNTTGATSGTGTVYSPGAHEFTPGFKWDSSCSIFSLFVLFLLAIMSQSFFDLRILITSLLSLTCLFYYCEYSLNTYSTYINIIYINIIDVNITYF